MWDCVISGVEASLLIIMPSVSSVWQIREGLLKHWDIEVRSITVVWRSILQSSEKLFSVTNDTRTKETLPGIIKSYERHGAARGQLEQGLR